MPATSSWARVRNEEPPKPDATRTFAMTLPLTDGAEGETLSVYVQGTAFAAESTYARLTRSSTAKPRSGIAATA